jgi:hypothetical protein
MTEAAEAAEATVESTEQTEEVLVQPEVKETPAEQPEEAAPSEAEESPKPKKDGGFQRRISELTGQKKALEEEVNYWRSRASSLPSQEAQAQKPEAPPKIEDYNNLEEFIEAKASYAARKIVEGTLTELQKQQAEHAKRTELEELHAKASERLEAARGKYEDFDEALGSRSELSEYMSEFILRTDDGMDVAYYLAKNPQESARIARMDDFNASLALADVRSKIKAPVKKSNAPPPINPVKGAAKGEKDPSEMTDAEFAAWRKKQIANRGNS